MKSHSLRYRNGPVVKASLQLVVRPKPVPLRPESLGQQPTHVRTRTAAVDPKQPELAKHVERRRVTELLSAPIA